MRHRKKTNNQTAKKKSRRGNRSKWFKNTWLHQDGCQWNQAFWGKICQSCWAHCVLQLPFSCCWNIPWTAAWVKSEFCIVIWNVLVHTSQLFIPGLANLWVWSFSVQAGTSAFGPCTSLSWILPPSLNCQLQLFYGQIYKHSFTNFFQCRICTGDKGSMHSLFHY